MSFRGVLKVLLLAGGVIALPSYNRSPNEFKETASNLTKYISLTPQELYEIKENRYKK